MWIAPELAATVAAIVDERSFEAAARRLRISPSAVSQRLRALESQLGTVLIIRSRPVRATTAGATIVRLARQYAVIAHEATVELGLERRDRMHVPIAVNADSLSLWLLPALEAVTHEHDVTFELLREDESHTAALLESGAALAAITSQERPIAGCDVTPLGATEYVAVATPGFVARWFSGGVAADALAAAPVIEFDRSDDIQSEWLRANGVDPDAPPRHYVPASEDYAAAVRLGMGWGMLPPAHAEDALTRGALVAIGPPDLAEPLFWQQWNLSSPALEAIRGSVVRHARAALAQG
ncbi:LysR family transcriptional regulator ArgP [Microbacterium halophytorum]|uniref:LysR family transcriptional regulator ArgP n=1 Tax=Microbacterium halophytorum TaxID=2067568 RepID=UPI000CFB9F54|nr:LysR family transcriptional regulator ArgP [Microbacterium halophytorum]